eukprot:1176261-Prorocentrum_minimum.AAC.1
MFGVCAIQRTYGISNIALNVRRLYPTDGGLYTAAIDDRLYRLRGETSGGRACEGASHWGSTRTLSP